MSNIEIEDYCPICNKKCKDIYNHNCDPKVLKKIDAAHRGEPLESYRIRTKDNREVYKSLRKMTGTDTITPRYSDHWNIEE